MKPVEKTVVHNVALASNLDYAQSLDRLEEPVAMVSQLNYIKPENPPAESGGFQETNGVVFQNLGGPKDLPESFCRMMSRL
ncbi:hypothetical protein [Caballeronia sp.]|uniref:hypothetical protein n=1 Tax=Caballeronia sp. TaxID=1931223 RepID=UPI003C661DE0